MAGVMSAVHCGQRRAAIGMLMVHCGQGRSVAAWSRSNSFSMRLTGSTTRKYTTVAEIRKDSASRPDHDGDREIDQVPRRMKFLKPLMPQQFPSYSPRIPASWHLPPGPADGLQPPQAAAQIRQL